LNLNRILRSACRRKILKALSKKQELNMMKLVHTVNSTYNEVNRNLRILENEGLVAQRHRGHNRIVRLNLKNNDTLIVLKILKLLNGSSDLKELRRKLSLITEGNSN
jgi:predicted transcriptional regulator